MSQARYRRWRLADGAKVPLAPLLLALAFVCAIPTGFHGGQLPVTAIEIAGTGYLVWRLRRGEVHEVLQAYKLTWPLGWWLGLSALLAALQILAGITSSPFETLRQLHLFTAAFALIPAAVDGAPWLIDGDGARWGIIALTVLLLISLVAGHLAMRQPEDVEDGIAWWPFVYRNHYVAFALLVLPVLAWRATVDAGVRWAAVTGAIAAVAGLVSCGSRSGLVLLACLTASFVLALAGKRWGRRAIPAFLGSGVVLILGFAMANLEVTSWRIRNAGSPLEGRIEFWRASVEMFAARPLVGWGFGTWPDVYPQYMERDPGLVVNHAHSDWLEFACEGGVLPLLALAIVLLRCLRLSWLGPWAIGLPAVFVLAMGDYPLRLPLILASVVALFAGTERIAERKSRLFSLPPILRIEKARRTSAIQPVPGSTVAAERRVPEGSA